MGSLNGIYGIISLLPAPTGSATEPTGILLIKLAMKATSAEDCFENKVSLLYILVHGTRNILDILLLYRKLQFKRLNLFNNVTFLTLHVYRLKERPFQTSIFLAHLSRRLTGELIVYPCSGVRRPSSSVVVRRSQFQRSSPLKPLGQSKPNFMWSILREGELKFI